MSRCNKKYGVPKPLGLWRDRDGACYAVWFGRKERLPHWPLPRRRGTKRKTIWTCGCTFPCDMEQCPLHAEGVRVATMVS